MSKRRGRGEGGLELLPSGAWRAVISLGRDPATGRRIRETYTAPTKGEAIAWRNEKSAELGRAGGATPGSAGRMTVGEWLTRWLAICRAAGLAPASLSRYANALDRHVRPGLGGTMLRSLRRPDVRAWLDGLEDADVPGGERAAALTVLRTALAEAARTDLVASNATAGLRKPKGLKKREPRPMTAVEAAAMIAAGEPRGMGVWFRLGVDSGMRPAEMLALHWTDLDLGACRVRVERSLCRITREEKPTKTKSGRRTIPVCAATAAALRAHLAAQRAHPWHAPGCLVFPSSLGTPVSYGGWVNDHFKPAARAGGIPALAPYDLRHTCATLLLAAGVSLRVVADRLGHSSPTITLKHYAHALPGMQEAARDAMAGLLPALSPTPSPRARRKSGPGK